MHRNKPCPPPPCPSPLPTFSRACAMLPGVVGTRLGGCRGGRGTASSRLAGGRLCRTRARARARTHAHNQQHMPSDAKIPSASQQSSRAPECVHFEGHNGTHSGSCWLAGPRRVARTTQTQAYAPGLLLLTITDKRTCIPALPSKPAGPSSVHPIQAHGHTREAAGWPSRAALSFGPPAPRKPRTTQTAAYTSHPPAPHTG